MLPYPPYPRDEIPAPFDHKKGIADADEPRSRQDDDVSRFVTHREQMFDYITRAMIRQNATEDHPFRPWVVWMLAAALCVIVLLAMVGLLQDPEIAGR